MDFGSIYHVMMSRDGICLSGDVYLPMDGGDSYPVVLHRTELARGRFSDLYHALNKAGIGVYVQSVRGRFGSGGLFEPYVHEGEDGIEAYQWLVRQPWCNGSILGFGAGYSAQALLSMWENGGGHGMAGAVLAGCGNNLARYGFRSNGVPMLLWLRQALEWAVDEPHFRGNPEEIQRLQWECSLLMTQPSQPFRKGATLLRHAPGIEEWCRRLTRDVSDDNDMSLYLGQGNLAGGCLPDLPLFMAEGWHDVFCEDALKRFQVMSNRNLSPLKLTICAGVPDFEKRRERELGKMTLGTKAFAHTGGSLMEQTAEWFRLAMDNGRGNPSPELRSIEFYQMGHLANKDGILRETGGRWQKALAWPPDNVRFFCFYLQPHGGLALKKSNGESASTSFASVPEAPAPSCGSVGMVAGPRADGLREARFMVEGKEGVAYPMPLIYRKDVISFTTGTLKREMVIVGAPKVRLFVKSKAPTSDFAVILADVLPDGETEVCFCQGIARYREMMGTGDAETRLNTPEILQFDLPPVCLAIGAGHRIRVFVTAGLFPVFAPNPNCASDMAAAGIQESTVNTVFHGGDASSMILMPIVHETTKKESE